MDEAAGPVGVQQPAAETGRQVLEGKEAELPAFDAGLPSTIDVKARA